MTATLVLLSVMLAQPRASESNPASPRLTPRITAPARIEDDRTQPFSSRTDPRYSDPRYSGQAAPADTQSNRNSRSLIDEEDPRAQESSQFSREPADTRRLEPVGRVNQKLRPPEIIAEALSTVPEGAFAPLEGEQSHYQTLTLTDAFKRSNDRAQQIKIAQSYWRLAVAQADYHFARDAVAQLRAATRGQLEQPALRAARCAMRALQRDAEVLVIRAQIRLSEDMRLPPTALPPLTVDIPHTASYNTHFEQVYSGRTAPPQAYALNRTIPVRQLAIEEHALAIQEAMDAVEDSIDEYSKGSADLTTLIVAFERLWKERKAFTTAIRDYNYEIAEYALPTTTISDPNKLVAMLIKVDQHSASSGTISPRSTAPRGSGPIDDEAPERFESPARRSNLTIPIEDDVPPVRGRTTDGRDSQLLRRITNYQSTIDRKMDFDEAHAPLSLFSALVDVETPLRTQRLSSSLHAAERLPREGSRFISLLDCLSSCPVEARRELIAAYWYAKEAATAYHVLANEDSDLAGLSQPATRARRDAGGPEAAIRLQSLRRSVKAAMLDAQYELALAQYELTTLCRGRVDQEWLLPSTPPHGGRYLLRLEDQPQEVIDSQGLNQRGAIVKVLHEQMEDHAGTVVYADLARATAMGKLDAGPEALNAAMIFVERQATHTMFFLRATTKYNLAIADYVLSVMPNNVPADELVSKLVLSQSRTNRT